MPTAQKHSHNYRSYKTTSTKNSHKSDTFNVKLKIWGKAQHESAQLCKSNWGEDLGGEITPVAKSRGPHSNALPYTERAMST